MADETGETTTAIDINHADDENEDVEEKLGSMWGTIRSKPTDEDVRYSESAEEKSKYKGQLLTTRSEIRAWYIYDWANSPLYNVIGSLLIPLFLSGLATHYGCNESDYGCDYNNDLIGTDERLVVYIGNWAVIPASFTFTMISISGGMQAVSYLGIGALADYSHYQFYLFRISTLIASLMTLGFVFLDDGKYYLFAGWWIAFQLVFFGLAIIFYNAYLPEMVENHWIVRRAIRNNRKGDTVVHLKQQLTDDLSQIGYALGYSGSLIMTIITVMVFVLMADTVYEQYDGYGLTTGNNIQSFDEQWLKKVYKIEMAFNSEYLTKIQLFYQDLDIDGGIYGVSTDLTTDTFEITNDEYITTIEYWYNNDASITSLRFTQQNDDISQIYGSATATDDANAIMSVDETDGNNFAFAGYKVYVSSTDNHISGMDTIMLNLETGQFASTWPIQLIFLLVFFWWNGFQIFTIKYLRRRDGPELPEDNNNPLTFSIKMFYNALRQATLYPNMFRYLLCWFMFSDGLTTMGVAAVLFATIELDFSSTASALLLLEVLLCGAAGGVLFLWIQRKMQWNAKQMLMLHLTILCICSLYTLFGLIPNSPIGLVSGTEMYLFGIIYGLNFGACPAYSRAVFSCLVPMGKEAQMFSLYEITDKGSSWIGPLTVAIISNIASIRWGMFYIFFFFIIPLPILIYWVNLKDGMKQAGRWKDGDDNPISIQDED